MEQLQETTSLDLKISSNGKDIVASGIAHLFENNITFKILNLILTIEFLKDNNGFRVENTVEGNDAKIIIFNAGKTTSQKTPVPVGTLLNRRLYVVFWSSTMDSEMRAVTYTFYLGEAVDGK
jgi:hypothetical protein